MDSDGNSRKIESKDENKKGIMFNFYAFQFAKFHFCMHIFFELKENIEALIHILPEGEMQC